MRIKEIRERRQLSQVELAKRLNLLPTTMYKYEKGLNKPSYKTLIAIADELQVSVDELLGRNTKIFDYSNLTKEQQQIIDIVLDFDELTQAKVLGYLLRLKDEVKEKQS